MDVIAIEIMIQEGFFLSGGSSGPSSSPVSCKVMDASSLFEKREERLRDCFVDEILCDRRLVAELFFGGGGAGMEDAAEELD
eukprot:CAMPEP_0198280300 /NCGR_PEP_ID=MMETSP1449-20131203/394_1 /TAXON_ID=420275 /ORGANISM="Attheya septentrionalis, Strain CCMP2084" /LENGTH=81 /DNA_ID=CAMNT_0043975611 /DNA_START=106 /DNA_END=352 /DNA_ORIENTATION=-